MDLSTILSDKPLPARTDSTERTDDKSRIEVDEPVGSGPDDEETATTSVAPEAKAEAKVETPAETPAEEKARNEKGQFQKTVPQEALHAERQKRQELERKLAEQSQKPPPSVLEDEDGAFNARIALATAPLQEKLFKLSVKAARNVPGREDYSEITSAFMEAADRDPQLIKAFREADDPGEYAYTVGKQIRELADVEGDILKYGAKKKAEGAAEAAALKTQLEALKAEIATLKAAKEKQARVPQSLNSEQSAAGKDNAFAGPRPIKDILFS
jgi:DNA repair exonuclease SbcCD ATPase subunit